MHDALEGIYPMSKTNKLKINIDDNVFYRQDCNEDENLEEDEIDLIARQMDKIEELNKNNSE